MTAATTGPRIAVVGCGLIGRAHIEIVAAGDFAQLAAIVDPAASGADLASAKGVPHFADLPDLLAADRPDGVVIATPNRLHHAQALAAIAARIPALVEKPIAATVAEGRDIVAAAQTMDVPVLIGHHRAHSPIMALARALVSSGRLGRLVSITGSAWFCKPDDYFRQGPWRAEPGGGPILINLIHEVHNFRLLCGEIVAVQAMAANAVRGFAVEDSAVINFRFANGALGSFALSDAIASARSWEQTAQENPAYPHYDDEDCYVVGGTMGSLAIPTMRIKSYGHEADRSWWKPFLTATLGLEQADPLQRQMQHFCRVIAGLEAPLVSAEDGLRNLIVIEAIRESLRTGHTVELAA